MTADKEKSNGAAVEAPVAEHHERGEWGSQCDFMLSCIGYAVGLGNVWRFPYLCYKNGGGAFLIPYVLMLLLAGLPLFCLELTIGQYASLGPNKLFQKLAPLFSGLGYGMLVISFLVVCYYNLIIAWTIFYTAASFTSQLGWSTCSSEYNTQNCFTVAEEQHCLNVSGNTEMFWNKTCYPISDYCENFKFTLINETHCMNSTNSSIIKSYDDIGNRISASEDYYTNYMLGLGDHDWSDFGGLKWDLALCLLAAWLIVGLCLIKGVQSSGKVVYFTALFPYFVLFILLIRGATLDGALDGVKFYITPNVTRLGDAGVWADAATQIFYSLGPSFGGLITLASYNRFKNNCMRDAIVVAFTNCTTSVFAGFVVFSILGFMAKQLGKEVKDVIASGQGLAFIAYPEAVVHMPISPLWAILFFAMLITLGLDSQFTMTETLTTALFDEWPQLRSRKAAVVMGTSVIGFILGLSMTANGGILMFTLIDWYASSWSLLLLALIEVVLVAWLYGAEDLLEKMQTEMEIPIPRFLYYYWFVMWKFVTPLVLFLITIMTFVQYEPASYGSGPSKIEFPPWVNLLGWLMAATPIVIVIGVGIYVYHKKVRSGEGYSWMDLLRPTDEWCPASERSKIQMPTNGSMKDRSGAENPSFVPEK
ncbi:sodium- and chloride-dependent glycine transporter 1-like [Amphibalanus amphitrite]|uniref:sodium- and chloride-dependent glycine transporter 1-like n=1 Tax=Amphibalanus amphitrite TaxID=1232801 RepID=UPI001C9128EF|nr:sodium- and chloride-dependent glycine transporter 1-like [Amphibalanus amphitrite]